MATGGDSAASPDVTISPQAHVSISDVYNLVPEFDGAPPNLDKFLACGNLLFSSTQSAAQQKLLLDIIKTKLRSPAFEVIQYKSYSGWNGLVQDLRHHFREEKSRACAQNELLAMKQRSGESVREFGDRLLSALSALDSATYSNITDQNVREYLIGENAKLAIQTFEDGLRNYSLKILLKAHGESDLRKAINYALEHAARLERASSARTTFPKPHTKGYHFRNRADQRNLTHDTNTRNNQLPNFTPQESNRIMCAYCKKLGHHMNDCRLRQYNNSRSAQITRISTQNAMPCPRVHKRRNNPNKAFTHELHYTPTEKQIHENAEPNTIRDKSLSENESYREEVVGNPSRLMHTAEVYQRKK